MEMNRLVVLLGRIASIGVVLFLLAVFALHVLSPGFNPVKQFISAYALGSYGAVASIAFLVQGLSWILLGIALSQGLARPGLSIVGLVLLFVSGVEYILFGIFPMDPDPQMPTTLAGTIHFGAGLLFLVTGGLFPLLLALRFKNDERTKPIYGVALGLGIAALAVDVVGFLLTGAGVEGLTQRLYVALLTTWVLLVALRMTSTGAEAGQTEAVQRISPS